MTALGWKVYDSDGEYLAALRYCESAAFVVPDGGTIRYGGRIVWREGVEQQPAAESCDFVARVCHDRVDTHNRAAYARAHKEERNDG